MRLITISILLALVSTLSAPAAGLAENIELSVQRRDAAGKPRIEKLSIDPKQTAIVVIDMWDCHTDPSAASRDRSLVPRMNQTFDAARQMGMQIIFAPSDVLGSFFLKDNPRRAAVAKLPKAAKPMNGPAIAGNPPDHNNDPSVIRAMGIPPNVFVPLCSFPLSQDPAIVIRNEPTDWLVDCNNNQELWNVMSHKGIKNLLYVGVHTNWCIWGRDSGMRKVIREFNVHPILLRDLTDAYGGNGKNASTGKPDFSWTFDRGTRQTVAWYEQNSFGSIHSTQLLAHDKNNRYAYANRVNNEPSLLSYWRMDGWNGDREVHDLQETQSLWNAENVMLGQPGAITGDPDTAAKFNGTSSLVAAPRFQANLPLDEPAGNSPLMNLSKGSFSVEAWARVDKLTGANQWIVAHDDGTNEGVDFLLGLNAKGQFGFVTRAGRANGAAAASAVTQEDVNAGRWFHVVAVQDAEADKISLYINGALAGEKKGLAGAASPVRNALQIGGRGALKVSPTGVLSGGEEFFNGMIDDVSIYGGVLSAEDVAAHHSLGTSGG